MPCPFRKPLLTSHINMSSKDTFFLGTELVVGNQEPTSRLNGRASTARLITLPDYPRTDTTTTATLLLAVTRFITSRLSFALPLGESDVASGFTGLTPLVQSLTPHVGEW